MFISKLNERIEAYDPYGEQRVNGVKVVYAVLIMFAVNYILPIPNPYFYFFFAPLFSMNADIAGNNIKEKFYNVIYCMILSIITVFVFNYFASYWFIFIVVFFYSLLLYHLFVNKQIFVVCIIPVSLAMGAYSLLYGTLNTNFYAVLNNSLTQVLAMIVILAAFLFFPLDYYYRLWLRTLTLLTQQTIDHANVLLTNQRLIFDPVTGHTTRMFRYAYMLPRHLPYYSIFKISALMNDLHLKICVPEHDELLYNEDKIKILIQDLTTLKTSLLQEKPCELTDTPFIELNKLIDSWNYILKTGARA
jgi:hypothetical protein